MQNGFVESLDNRLRDECVNERLFGNLHLARDLIAGRRTDDSHRRPHTRLHGRTPGEYHQR